MLCDCGNQNQLIIGTFVTQLGNEIEYMECEDCGVVEVNGTDIEKEEE